MENIFKHFDTSRRHHLPNRTTTTALTVPTFSVAIGAPTTFPHATRNYLHRPRYGLDLDHHQPEPGSHISDPNFRAPRVEFLPPPVFGANLSPLRIALSESDLDTESGSEFCSDDASYGEHDYSDEYDDGFGGDGDCADVDGLCYEDEEDQVSFVNDLFDRRRVRNRDLDLSLGLPSSLSDEMDDSDSPHGGGIMCSPEMEEGESSEIDLELGLGLGSAAEDVAGPLRGRNTFNFIQPKSSESISGLGQGSSFSLSGLREVGIGSETDSDENVSFFNGPYYSDIDDFDEYGGMNAVFDDEFDHGYLYWDSLGNNDRHNNSVYSFESEEGVDAHLVGPEVLGRGSSIATDRIRNGDDNVFTHWDHSSMDDDDNDDARAHVVASVQSVIEEVEEEEEVEEIEFGGGLEQAFHDLEWEILQAANAINTELDDALFGVESLNEWRGNPPASKLVIERLPLVNLSKEEIIEREIACAVCKVDILVEEQVRMLPCQHYYHGECIIPWLKISNTCPVCRFELRTDDPEYEFRKRVSTRLIDEEDDDSGEFSDGSQMSYDNNFHVFL